MARTRSGSAVPPPMLFAEGTLSPAPACRAEPRGPHRYAPHIDFPDAIPFFIRRFHTSRNSDPGIRAEQVDWAISFLCTGYRALQVLFTAHVDRDRDPADFLCQRSRRFGFDVGHHYPARASSREA